MTRQEQAQGRRNCPGLYPDMENLLDALCEAIWRRKLQMGGMAMVDVLQVIFVFGFGLIIGWGLGRNTR